MIENREWSGNAHPRYLGEQMRDPARRAEFVRWLRNCQDATIAARIFSIVYSGMQHEGAWLRPENMPEYMPGADQMPRTLEHPDTVWTMGALAEGRNPLTSLRDRDQAPHPERTDAPDRYSLSICHYNWASRDPESAGLWLIAQPPSPERDQAVTGYLQSVGMDDPAAAVQWAGQLTDPGARTRHAAAHYAGWHLRQPAEASAWLESAGFPEIHRLYIAGMTGGTR